MPEMKPAHRLADPLPGDNLIGHWHGACQMLDPNRPGKILTYQFLSHKRADGSMLIELLYGNERQVSAEEGRWTRRGKITETLTTRVGRHYTNPNVSSNQDSYRIEKETENEVQYRDQRHGILFTAHRVDSSYRLNPAPR